MDFPDHWGMNFTQTQHESATGPTLPENNKVPSDTPFVVLVTGAGKGLGYHISLAYVRAGATGLIISSRTQSDLDKLEKELLTVNPQLKVLSQICDTSKPEDVQSLASATKEKFNGQLDVVVANAGIISAYVHDTDPDTGEKTNRRLPVGVVEDDDFKRVNDINYMGTYYTAKYLTPLLTSSPSKIKAFIVITSTACHCVSSSIIPVAYAVSKLAVNRLVEHIALDHGKEGVQAFAVHPGEVLTPQTERHSTQKGDVWDSSKRRGNPRPDPILTTQ